MENTKSLIIVALMLLLSVGNSKLLAQTTLVNFGSSWSYYDNQNEPSDQGPIDWNDNSYDDSAWSTGNAELGYGDGDEATVTNSNAYTTYFRHTFNVVNANAYSGLSLNLVYDDGAVVYLNGSEVWRVNMPSGTITYNTFTPTQGSDNAQISTVLANSLISGTNVISVEIHQRSSTSSDISFDFQLTADESAPPSGGDLIEAGSSWKYLDDGSDQGTAWRGTGFNDSSWASGNAQLGFGEGDEATVISDVNQITNYFRKTITVSAAQAASANLLLEAIRDDGIVVYINGTEVWRDYMPAGTINYNTTATTHVPDDGNDWQTNTIANSLVVGTNVIAVEIHQNSSTSSDVSFDFKMTDSGGSPPTSDEFITDTDTWKYLDDGSNQGTAWYGTGFDDSSWASGAAELGYGDGGEATTVSFGSDSNNKHVTTYFRKTFNVTDPSAYDYLSLEAIRDDGMVVYLNGVEVWNDGLPSSFDYLTYATQTIGGSDESTWISKAIANTLVTGTNVVAVEIHQTNATSSDISFNFRLSGSTSGGGTANIERGPYLQKGTTTSVVVRWRTDVPTESIVNYGTNLGSLNQNESDLLPKTEHEIEITGLNPDTKYYYSIVNNVGTIISESSDLYFETHPTVGTAQPYKFWILGDAGTANSNQRAVRDAYYNYIGSNHTDGILFLGDNAYNSGTDSEYQNAMFENMYEDKLKNTIAWSTLGNHDGYSADSNSQTGPYYDIFTFPTSGESGGMASGTEAYYSFDYGNIHFIVLDSYETDRSVGGTMYNWAQSDIQNTTQEWIVAFWHHPPYTKGSHDSDTESELIDMRENFLPMLEGNGVDLVLNGHSHSYERSYLLNGHYGSSNTFNFGNHTVGVNGSGDGKADGNGAYVKETSGPEAGDGAVYITTGSAGKISGGSLNHNAMYASLNELGSCILEVDGNTLHVKFIRETGTIDDYFTIEKGCTSDSDGDGVCDADDICPGSDDNIDTDGDGTPDGCDTCPNSAAGDSDGDGICDDLDVCPGNDDTVDTDGDATPDGCDICPGSDDTIDSDGDGTPDGCDACPNSATGDSDGDGVCDNLDICPGSDDTIDSDGDGTPDGCDACPNSAAGDSDGDGICDDLDICPGSDDTIDSDGDGTPDGCDACPNSATGDSDGDGVCDDLDICPGSDDNIDSDGDGTPDGCDACPNSATGDSDGDGVCDDLDICPGSDDNVDSDGDGTPDGCDACPNSATGDSDGDGVCDDLDACPGLDDSLIGTPCDDGNDCTINDVYDENCGCSGTLVTDSDGDGVCDDEDVCPGSDDNIDSDGDGTPDGCDDCPNSATGDSDGDGVCDDLDICPGYDDTLDSDGDGAPDSCDICPGSDDNIDNDGDGTPDGCDACPNSATGDSDGDGVCDDLDICPGSDDNIDSDGDGTPDGCDACPNSATGDSDGDGVCDDLDICPGSDDNVDSDGDGTPDGCDACPNSATGDSDGDGVCDDLDICPGSDDNVDSDGDGTPDGCDTCPNSVTGDSDGDGVCDDLDICPGFDDNLDVNDNGIPDDCENSCSYYVIDFNNFDSSWGIWNDGGSDSRRSSNDAIYSNGGTGRSVRLRDDSSTSVMTTDNLDLTAYEEITVDFNYYARSMDNSSEDFWLQISTDGGSSYITVEEWNRDDEFVNDSRYFDQVIIPGPFTSNTRLRFRCDASGNSDWVYIDDVEISGCFNNNLLSPVEDILEETIVEENDIEETKSIKVYPIPASRTLYVDCKMYDGTKATISLYNIRGSLVKTVSLNGDYSEPQKIDLDKLSDGLYLLVMKDLNGNVLENKRILVSNE